MQIVYGVGSTVVVKYCGDGSNMKIRLDRIVWQVLQVGLRQYKIAVMNYLLSYSCFVTATLLQSPILPDS